MTITISVGTRFPAYATSMGRVLLAGQSDEWLDGYFASVELRRLTARTVTDVDALRAELLLVRARAGRSSTRSSRKGCAPSPLRSTISRGVSPPRSTCRRR